MASPTKPAVSAAPPPVVDDSPSEHIYIGGDEFSGEPGTSARTLRETIAVANPVRHTGVALAFYDEGYVRITTSFKRNDDEPFLLDLRFIDPIPRIERVVAARSLYTALGSAAVAGLAAFLLRFDALYVFVAPLLGAAVVAAAVALYTAIYRSYELIEYRTLHGRAVVLRLVANFGAMKKFRSLIPALSHSIEEATERIGADTSAYLRAEMREHYRLRGDGILDNDTCAAGTGRILAQFDVQI
jgi:hypothetical protein